MILHIVGTGSSGNSYILESENSALIIEAGLSLLKVKEMLNYNINKIEGAIISHSHKDHSEYIKEYINSGITTYMNEETFSELDINNYFAKHFNHRKSFYINDFKILPFELIHDVECSGFQIEHKEMGKTVFVTDTEEITYSFSNVNNWIIEANYSESILFENTLKGDSHVFLTNRIVKNHLSIEKLIDYFSSQDLTQTNNIIITHSSDRNSDSLMFKDKLIESTGKNITIAKNGLKINFNKTM